MGNMMTNQCEDARPLIPSYLDGELSEAQAAPLRKHLLACQPCRASAQDEKSLKRWFVEPAQVPVPAGFASRVARRAFAGDLGADSGTLVPAAPPAGAIKNEPNGKLLHFVLQMTAVAAVLLVFLSVAIGNLRLPDGRDVRATNEQELSLDEALNELERLNREEPATGAPGSEAPTPEAAGR